MLYQQRLKTSRLMKTVQFGVQPLSTVCLSNTSLRPIRMMKGFAQQGSTEYVLDCNKGLYSEILKISHIMKTAQCGVQLLLFAVFVFF